MVYKSYKLQVLHEFSDWQLHLNYFCIYERLESLFTGYELFSKGQFEVYFVGILSSECKSANSRGGLMTLWFFSSCCLVLCVQYCTKKNMKVNFIELTMCHVLKTANVWVNFP